MSMDFSEFLRHLGADPHSRDPELLSARHSDPQFQQAAEEAEAFEARIEQAMGIPAPENLLKDILEIGSNTSTAAEPRSIWRTTALAAGVLIAVGAAGVTWNMNRGWESVDQYLVDHYQYDGESLINKSGPETATGVQAIFAEFAMEAAPELADIISVIKYCPTPDGKGIHMVLNTEEGIVTLIYMPETPVADGQSLEFEGKQALLVGLEKGSAAIIGNGEQMISNLYPLVRESILPVVSKA